MEYTWASRTAEEERVIDLSLNYGLFLSFYLEGRSDDDRVNAVKFLYNLSLSVAGTHSVLFLHDGKAKERNVS